MITDTKHLLMSLFELKFKEKPTSTEMLPRSGSDRVYFRIKSENHSAIGAYNSDTKENEAFFSFSQTLINQGIKVPSLYAIAPDRQHYLLSDLGNKTLYDCILKPEESKCGKTSLCLIKETLNELLLLQLKGSKAIDFSKSYPREKYDRQSIIWDLNYFKYEFLKLTAIPFDEQALEDDFNSLADYLLEAPSDYFMHRDFQSRNVMIIDSKPWFIDYQGGRKGPLQYDLASLLYSPKTKLNDTQREVMLEYYLNKLEAYIAIDRAKFVDQYYSFVLIRILQALGAYGFRGIFEGKPNFRSSIPDAINNINNLLERGLIKIRLPEIEKAFEFLKESEWAQKVELPTDRLTVRITSFTFKKGIPFDPSENGGGFVFDCRGLPNPGRFKEYKTFSGKDKKVIDYLEEFPVVTDFNENVKKIIGISLNEYIERGFNHLCINFGCTGGQHRSVYNAEKIASWVENNFPVNVVLLHTEQENWKKDE